MSKSKHTPGPWHNVGECVMEGNIDIICTDPSAPAYEWEFVGSVHYGTDEEDVNTFSKETAEANAHLILVACNAARRSTPRTRSRWLKL